MRGFRFEIADCDPDRVAQLQRELQVSGALAQVLVRRGLQEPEAARAFLAADETHPAETFAGIATAVEPVLRHIRARSLITVHGDYDVDGVCSTAVLVATLRGLGAEVDHLLPDRAEGYGLSVATVERLAARGTRLLITADCGITAVEEVAAARALGIEVVVSDHHSPRGDGTLPDAPIVHPTLCSYPGGDLCATAVAHKLAQALVAAARREGLVDPARGEAADSALAEDLDLVALATVADVMTLRGENRALVRRGLRVLARTRKPGLRALMGVAGVDPASVNERALGFALGPRLNAAGRLYRADAGLELLLTRDPERAAEIARELDDANRERRRVELGIRLEAEAQMDALGERGAYVLASEGWHPGVIGIVASRLVERSGRPVVMIALDGERGRGSGRSVEAFDLLAGLQACSAHLTGFGGHAAAAGLDIERGAVPAFAAALAAEARSAIAPEDIVEVERVDALVSGEELGMELAEELAALAPFGRGNPTVSLMLPDATFSDARGMGEGKHVRFTVRSGGARARAVAFGGGASLPVPEGEPVAASFRLEVNEWNGVSEPRLVLRRAAPAQATAQAPAHAPDGAAPAPHGPATPVRSAPTAEEEGELVLFALP